MRLAYVLLSLLPSAAVFVLAWYVIRGVSVRVVWRRGDTRQLDDETA